MKPVYMINGFLESGKSEFITYTIAQPYFQTRGKTLLILCEEGEVEYDRSKFKGEMGTFHMEVVEDEEDLTPEFLSKLQRMSSPCRTKPWHR